MRNWILRIAGETEPTGTQGGTNQLVMDGVSNLAGYMSSYVYTAWYNVEMDTPVDSDVTSAEDAYALKNVFYFLTGLSTEILRQFSCATILRLRPLMFR